MKKMVISLLAFVFVCGSSVAFAAGPDSVTLQAKFGNVTFNHKAHSAKLACQACHEGTPSKIALDKTKAHTLCKGCHQEKGSGPTKCRECHKK